MQLTVIIGIIISHIRTFHSSREIGSKSVSSHRRGDSCHTLLRFNASDNEAAIQARLMIGRAVDVERALKDHSFGRNSTESLGRLREDSVRQFFSRIVKENEDFDGLRVLVVGNLVGRGGKRLHGRRRNLLLFAHGALDRLKIGQEA